MSLLYYTSGRRSSGREVGDERWGKRGGGKWGKRVGEEGGGRVWRKRDGGREVGNW
jgi:hypothetical protein